jgi:hypothetical protein
MAQVTAVHAGPPWEVLYAPKFYAGTTRAAQATIVATLGEIERILGKVPEIAQPKGFTVRKNAQGAGRRGIPSHTWG